MPRRSLKPPRPLFALVTLALALGCGALLPTSQLDQTPPPPLPLPDDASTATSDAEWHPATDAGLPPKTPGAVRIATYNVHRFFDTVCDSGACGGTNYEELPSAQEFARRADELAAAIRGLDASVVMLEEVETQACLDALMQRLGPEYVTGVLGEIGTSASVDVAVVSKLPLSGVKLHRGLTPLMRADGSTTDFSRELLELRLTDGARQVVAFAAHFRSKVNDDPERRLLEAQATHDIMKATAAELPSALIVLGGDLNDTPGSPPLDALEAGGDLERVERELDPNNGTWGPVTNPQPLDHLYRAAKAGGSAIPGTSHVARDPGGGGGWGGSDHAALFADFRD